MYKHRRERVPNLIRSRFLSDHQIIPSAPLACEARSTRQDANHSCLMLKFSILPPSAKMAIGLALHHQVFPNSQLYIHTYLLRMYKVPILVTIIVTSIGISPRGLGPCKTQFDCSLELTQSVPCLTSRDVQRPPTWRGLIVANHVPC